MTTGQESLIDRYVHEPAYSIVGKRLDRPHTAGEALVQAGLDFSVIKRPVKAILPSGKLLDVPEKFATVSSTGKVLGVVGSRYEVVQPVQHFAFFDPIVSRKEAVYVSAGLAHNGTKLWLLCKIPGHVRVQHTDCTSSKSSGQIWV